MKVLSLLLFIIPMMTLAQSEEESVKQIRKWYKEVEDRLDQCIKVPVTMFYDEDYVNGGSTEIEGYFDTINKSFIKIIETTYYDWAEDITSYYFHNGELFFIFQKGSHAGEMYTAEELKLTEEELWQSGGEAKTMIFYEKRNYFNKGICIRNLSKRKEVGSEEDGDLKEVDHEKIATDDPDAAAIYKHGLKIYKQLSPKK